MKALTRWMKFTLLLSACGSNHPEAGHTTDGATVTDVALTCGEDESRRFLCTQTPRKTISWKLSGSDLAKQATALPESGCRELPAIDGLHFENCQGLARVELANSIPSLIFVDGSRLTFNTDGVDKPIAPPMVEDGDTVWVNYSDAKWRRVPNSQLYQTGEIQIRESATGPLLWLGMQGGVLVTGSEPLIMELFGDRAATTTRCTFQYTQSCWTEERILFDHVFLTPPVQKIPHAQPTQVTTATGMFEVYWADSNDTQIAKGTDFCDSDGLCGDRGFAASRIGTP